MTFSTDQQHSPLLDPSKSSIANSPLKMDQNRDELNGNSEANERSNTETATTDVETTQITEAAQMEDFVNHQKQSQAMNFSIPSDKVNQTQNTAEQCTQQIPFVFNFVQEQPSSPTKTTKTQTISSFQTSPYKNKLQRKLWEVTGQIFLKNLTEIQQTSREQQKQHHNLSTQLKERIHKFSKDCLGLLRMALRNSQSIEPQERSHLELANYFILAQDILIKDQSSYQEVLQNMEKLFRLSDVYPELTDLESVKSLELNYIHLLLKCGLLKKAERALISFMKQLKDDKTKDTHELRFLCLKSEFHRLSNQIADATEKTNEIESMRTIDGLFLRLNLLIDEKQLEKATYMIQQSLEVITNHPLWILSLKNLQLKIYILKKQFKQFHDLMRELRKEYHDNNLTNTIEYSNALILESQALLAEVEEIKNKTEYFDQANNHSPNLESLLQHAIEAIDQASQIGKILLHDRFHYSTISGDIYQLKASILMELSTQQKTKKDQTKTLKQALQFSQLAIQIRKNYLYQHCDKNTKVLESLQLQVNLLSLSNRSREHRKASAELLEYELV